MIDLRDNTKFYIDNICFNDFLAERSLDHFILKCTPHFPDMNHEFETFAASDGQRIINSRFNSYPFELVFYTKTENKYNTQLIINEIKDLLFRRSPFFISYSLEPGKRFKVITEEMKEEVQNTRFSIFTVLFNVFEGRSESLASTQSNFNLEEDWQFSQGLAAEDYQYTHETSRFTIFNGGDFTVDPREHDLTIRIEGESDGEFILFNRTTGDRFIYYPPLHRRYGESLVLESVYPRKNGVSCGIDTNHGVITLAPGENHMELQNISRVKSEWDFRFLYK